MCYNSVGFSLKWKILGWLESAQQDASNEYNYDYVLEISKNATVLGQKSKLSEIWHDYNRLKRLVALI